MQQPTTQRALSDDERGRMLAAAIGYFAGVPAEKLFEVFVATKAIVLIGLMSLAFPPGAIGVVFADFSASERTS
jgi:hypothetical protein